MSLLDSIFGATTLKEPDTWLSEALNARPTASGQSVTPDSAMRVTTVYACTRVLAESVASLPLHLYRRGPDGRKEKATDHPLYSLLHDLPNREMTSYDLRELQMAQLCLRGNAYARLYRKRNGEVGEIVPWKTQKVRIDRDSSGRLVFLVEGEGTFYHDSVWRIPGLGGDGIVGYTPIGLAREAIGLALATEQHGAALFGNGAHPLGVLETDGVFQDEEAIERLRSQFQERYSGSNAHKPLILEKGLKWQQISLSSEDAQFLETRKFQRSEICAIYRVPPHMIADLERATFSNIEHQSLEFVMHTLRPWLVRFEQSIHRDILTPAQRKRYFVSFSVEGLLRGDIKSRYEAYSKAIVNGWMNRNEVRALENMNPADGLDEFLVPTNMDQNNGKDQTDR